VDPFGHAEQVFKEPFVAECRALFAGLETALWGYPPLEDKLRIGADLR
jgi:hypothetical protein